MDCCELYTMVSSIATSEVTLQKRNLKIMTGSRCCRGEKYLDVIWAITLLCKNCFPLFVNCIIPKEMYLDMNKCLDLMLFNFLS